MNNLKTTDILLGLVGMTVCLIVFVVVFSATILQQQVPSELMTAILAGFGVFVGAVGSALALGRENAAKDETRAAVSSLAKLAAAVDYYTAEQKASAPGVLSANAAPEQFAYDNLARVNKEIQTTYSVRQGGIDILGSRVSVGRDIIAGNNGGNGK